MWWWLGCLSACWVDSAFVATAERCGWSQSRLDAEMAFGEPVYPSRLCVDQVLDDLSVDVGSLMMADGLSDPYGVVYGEPVLQTRLGTLLAAMRLLQIVDLGLVKDLPAGGWSGGAFASELRETAQQTGQGSVGAALYDRIVERTAQTIAGPLPRTAPPAADAALNQELVLMWDLVDAIGPDAAGLLVHEARHADGPRHVPCGDGRGVICDLGSSGAVGFQIGLGDRLRAATDEDDVRGMLDERIAALASRVR